MQKIQIQKLLTLTGHRDSIYTLQRAAKPNEFFSASGDGMIVSWDLNNPDTGHLIARLPNSVYALQLQANAPEILIAGQNYEGIHLLDWQNKKQIGSLQLTKAAIFDIQCREEMAFVACGDGLLAKIHLGQMQVLKKDHSANKSARAISIHTERGEVAVGYSDHFIRVFDLDSLQLKYEWQAHANSVFTVRYTPDGKLVSGSRDARLKFWDPVHEYGQLTEIVAHMYAINHLDFSPDKKHFVTCSLDKSVKIWDATDLKLLKVIDRARHAGHSTSVNKVLWSAHHDQLLSASDDRTIAVWHIIF